MNTELWTYRESIMLSPAVDLVGFHVEARDGSIGKIDETSNETGRAFLVVDTGPWIFGRKVLIPAGAVDRVDVDDRKVFVSLTKDQIKDSPEFESTRGYDEEYRNSLGTYYERSGWAA
jgi:PRC-barrel domain protein